VGELAVGAVDLAPFMKEGDDLGDLLGRQPVDRAAARPRVLRLVGGAAFQPPPRGPLIQLQDRAGRSHRPALVDGVPSRSSRPALVAASTRGGTRPLSR
jgi:hypothetical protein